MKRIIEIPLIYKGISPLTLEMIEQEILDALYPNEFWFIKISVDCRFLELKKNLSVFPKILPILDEMNLDINYELLETIHKIVENFDYVYKKLDSNSNNTILAETLIIKYSPIFPDNQYNALLN